MHRQRGGVQVKKKREKLKPDKLLSKCFPIRTDRDQNSRYNVQNFNAGVVASGLNIKGPIWRPVRLVMNLILFAFVLIVPVLYGIIFR